MRIGIDLGGTKIEALLLDEDGTECARERVPTPQNDYEGTVGAIVDLVHRVEALPAMDPDGPAATVGVGTPGAISRATGKLKNANSTWLNGRALQQDIESRLGREIRMANDANCFALSEAVDGSATPAAIHGNRPGARDLPFVVFGVILGTGTGGGIVVNEEVLVGPNNVAGEWGHNPLPGLEREPFHPECYCGRHGCVETFLSGPGMSQDHQRSTGQTLTAEEIAARAAGDDPDAEATLVRYETRLAQALGALINTLDPDVIVLGGGLSQIERLYENVPKLWSEFAFSDTVETALVPPLHGDSSGVRGAAWLWGREPRGLR